MNVPIVDPVHSYIARVLAHSMMKRSDESPAFFQIRIIYLHINNGVLDYQLNYQVCWGSLWYSVTCMDRLLLANHTTRDRYEG